MKKKALTVYSPDDKWESAIQDSAKHFTGNWLPAYPCQLLSKTICSLKLGTDWLDNEKLFPARASYFFSDHLMANKQERVFATQLLFLRDILENREINAKLHEPMAFMTTPLAYFLFRDCPVHIHINEGLLRAANKKIEFVDVGGFLIAKEGNIEIKDGVVSDVRYYGRQDSTEIKKVVDQIRNDCGLRFMKAAATEVAFDVFEIDEHFKDIRPGSKVWDKINRSEGNVVEVQPGETGIVHVEYPNGKLVSIPKQEFDLNFVIM